ncbi:hypothetical protein YC2023_014966 [Brassica napus]
MRIRKYVDTKREPETKKKMQMLAQREMMQCKEGFKVKRMYTLTKIMRTAYKREEEKSIVDVEIKENTHIQTESLLHSSTTEQEFKMGLVRIMKNVINVVSLNKAAFKVVLLKDKDKLT